MNRGTAARLGLGDFDWVWVESHHGRLRCQLKTMEGVEANTVWTWNAVGRQAGTAGGGENARGTPAGVLLNHFVSGVLPQRAGDERPPLNTMPGTRHAPWGELRA